MRRRFHALRYTVATRALKVKTLSEILGHKNTTIALNQYMGYVYSLFFSNQRIGCHSFELTEEEFERNLQKIYRMAAKKQNREARRDYI